MGIIKPVDLGVGSLPINTRGEIVDGKPVGSKEARQFDIYGTRDRAGRVEIQYPRNETVGFRTSVNEKCFKDLGEVAMTTVCANGREGVIRGDESLRLPGCDDTLLHRIIGDGDRLGLGSEGDLKPIDGEEDPSSGVRHNVVGDERSLSAPKLRLVQHVDSVLKVLFHRSRVWGIPTSELLHRDGEESSIEVEGLVRHVHERAKADLCDRIEDTRVNAVAASVNIRSALRDVKSSDVSLIGPTSGIWDGMKLLGIIAEVVLVTVA